MREGHRQQEPTDQKAISGTRRAVWLGLEPEGLGGGERQPERTPPVSRLDRARQRKDRPRSSRPSTPELPTLDGLSVKPRSLRLSDVFINQVRAAAALETADPPHPNCRRSSNQPSLEPDCTLGFVTSLNTESGYPRVWGAVLQFPLPHARS